MDTTATVIVAVIVLLAIVALVLILAGPSRMRHPKLKPLTPEAQDRYVSRWDGIEARFVDSPDEAVKEADALMLALLGEREHPLTEDRLPDRMRKARRLGSGREGKGGTEGMRQALLHYRAVIEEYARPVERHERTRDERTPDERTRDEETRREIAG
jgi:hypothetical protein